MSADVDIDFADRQQIINLIQCTPARQNAEGRKHNSGVYVTLIPIDAPNGCASIDYEYAEQRGYFKLDLLNQSVYTLIRDQEHYDSMLAKEPDWTRLQDRDFCKKVVHVGNYHDLLCAMQPDSIPRMAAFISIIRPGKAHLQRKPWNEVFATVWDGDDTTGFVFKKSHAVSYARLVALHINLLCEPE
tara:strand:- start:21450 stop:22010 length:561 start_codon:yes stop_codon:yes gene_type:complete